MASKNDKLILGLKKEVESKKTLLASLSKFSPVTNCSFEYAGLRINIHTANKEMLLLLIANVEALKQSLKTHYPEEKLVINGYTADEWLTDLKSKFDHLNVAQEKAKLKILEERLHDLLSSDTKVSLEIENLTKQIKGE
jgi:hypothetical protein